MRLPWPQVAMPGGKEAHGRELLSALEASGAYVCSALLEHEEQAVRDVLHWTAAQQVAHVEQAIASQSLGSRVTCREQTTRKDAEHSLHSRKAARSYMLRC